jgi:ribA/ribD-fused uncharacterized protein
MPRKVIKFYRHDQPCFCFTNFARFPVKLKGKTWPTSEHYYQAQKFEGTEWEEKIRLLKTPKEAARQGRDRSLPLRQDWEEVKDEVMSEVLSAKFTQSRELKAILLATRDAVLIEDSPVDYYWGCGKDGSGQNKLGKMLMALRDRLRQE